TRAGRLIRRPDPTTVTSGQRPCRRDPAGRYQPALPNEALILALRPLGPPYVILQKINAKPGSENDPEVAEPQGRREHRLGGGDAPQAGLANEAIHPVW